MTDNHTELAVIGAGPGGYAAAFLAADLGMDVTLIDPEENPGGVCLYRGCIPSKTLLHAAKVINEAGEIADWGIRFNKPGIDIDKLRSRKDAVIVQLTGGLGQLIKQRKIRYLKATAGFIDSNTLDIDLGSGANEKLNFRHAIIATGSHPVSLPMLDYDSDRILDSTVALNLEDIPKKLLVIGGGYIGLELGTVYAALGSSVTVVEMTSGLLPGVDRDLVRIVKKRVENTFESVLLNTTVKGAKSQKNGIKVELEDNDGNRQGRLFDKVLASVGRRPNSKDLGLANTGVQINKQGFVKVDAQQRTDEPTIFAIGDVAGEPMLAHKASYEGRIAVEVIAGQNVAFEPSAIPAVVFTDPEIAWAGLTETEAKEKKVTHTVARFPWAASGRALSLGRTDGLTKMIIDPNTERILGVGIAGVGAGEMIAEAVLGIEMAANVTDVSLSIHPHPTLTETIKEAAEIFHGIATHVYRKRRK
jgi:dihydrolipoamide dehydrogenase